MSFSRNKAGFVEFSALRIRSSSILGQVQIDWRRGHRFGEIRGGNWHPRPTWRQFGNPQNCHSWLEAWTGMMCRACILCTNGLFIWIADYWSLNYCCVILLAIEVKFRSKTPDIPPQIQRNSCPLFPLLIEVSTQLFCLDLSKQRF